MSESNHFQVLEGGLPMIYGNLSKRLIGHFLQKIRLKSVG